MASLVPGGALDEISPSLDRPPTRMEITAVAMTLSEDRRNQLLLGLEGFYLEQFDEQLSRFRAEHILDFLLSALGPPIYNQAVQDAQAFMQAKLDELDGEVYAPRS